jgi:hypothetical protein
MPISTEFHSDLKELVLSLLLECMSELVFEQYYCGSASITVAAAAAASSLNSISTPAHPPFDKSDENAPSGTSVSY